MQMYVDLYRLPDVTSYIVLQYISVIPHLLWEQEYVIISDTAPLHHRYKMNRFYFSTLVDIQTYLQRIFVPQGILCPGSFIDG
jgi:hypothetical protein